MRKGEDALGNITHTAFVPGPISRLTVTVEGEIVTWETHGLVRGAMERFAPEVFLAETPLTRADAGCRPSPATSPPARGRTCWAGCTS